VDVAAKDLAEKGRAERDLAARLRGDELDSIRALSEKGLVATALRSLDDRGGAQELVRQQYSGRYPFELLQNASDAALDTGMRGRVRFVLTDTALLVADNGAGFGDRQVDAICSLGRSSKGPGTAIGHKGLGFKSVGEISDRPQIVSPQASFQFDGERLLAEVSALLGPLPAGQRLPVYAVPFPVQRADLGPDAAACEELRADGLTTVVRLPFRVGVLRQTVAEHLVANLQPRLLLFLPAVDSLEMQGTDADFAALVVREPDGMAERTLLESAGVAAAEESPTRQVEEWLVYRGVAMPERAQLEPLGGTWMDLREVKYAVAVPIGEDGEPRVDQTFPLHAYFPTDEEPGLHVAVHAEWALSMDRRQLAAAPEASPFNQMVVEAVAGFVAAKVAGDLLRRTDSSPRAVQAIVPAPAALSPHAPGGAAAMRRGWTTALRRTRFLPCASGDLGAPVEVRLLPENVPDLAQAHALAALDGRRILRADVELVSRVRSILRADLGAEVMSATELLVAMRFPTPETAADYYAFLVAWRAAGQDSLLAEMKKTLQVLTVQGEAVSPARTTVFLPRTRGDSSIPIDIPVPIADVPDIEGIEGLLRELGVRPFEWRELIQRHLAGILRNPEAEPGRREQALAALRVYRTQRPAGSDGLASVLGSVLLPARTADRRNARLRAAGRIYFGREWTGTTDLEEIYGPFNEAEFLDAEVPADVDQKQTEMGFYRMLGVQDHPRLDVHEDDHPVGGRHPHGGPLFAEWMRQPEVAAAAACSQQHPSSQSLRRSAQLDRHAEIVGSKDAHRLAALWRQLALHWRDVYGSALRAEFHCGHSSRHRIRSRFCDSLFAYTLRSRPWVPVDRIGKVELVRPAEAWIDATEPPRWVRWRIPRVSQALLKVENAAVLAKDLDLVDAARPRAADLLLLLKALAAEADEVGTASGDVVRAARWAQRTLDDVLGNDERHPNPETTRLLATHDGRSCFAAQPPYTDDPTLRETLAARIPVLATDTGSNRLVRYFSLIRLDDTVAVTPHPYGLRDDAAAQRIRGKVDQIKPYLFTILRAENSRASDRAAGRLRRLEIVACTKLVLRYDIDGETVERDDAVCYIATRREGNDAIGTAYLELDPATDEPHWFPLGRQLAQFLGAPSLADAFVMLLTARPEDRARLLADRQIQQSDVADAAYQLHLSFDDEELGRVLDILLPAIETDAAAPPHAGLPSAPEPGATSHPGGGGRTAAPQTAAPLPADPPGNRPDPEADVAPTPEVDYAAVPLVDVVPGVAPTSRGTAGGGGYGDYGGYGGASSAPGIQTETEKRRVGKLGEKIAYHVERERLHKLGQNPDSVRWVSAAYELAPYDLVSVDADGQQIYIEVKSTKNADPREPFYISRGELLEAVRLRSSYYIYRVTSVGTGTPAVARWNDPLAAVMRNDGSLLLADARMALPGR
jgi:hypothetical protein